MSVFNKKVIAALRADKRVMEAKKRRAERRAKAEFLEHIKECPQCRARFNIVLGVKAHNANTKQAEKEASDLLSKVMSNTLH